MDTRNCLDSHKYLIFICLDSFFPVVTKTFAVSKKVLAQVLVRRSRTSYSSRGRSSTLAIVWARGNIKIYSIDYKIQGLSPAPYEMVLPGQLRLACASCLLQRHSSSSITKRKRKIPQSVQSNHGKLRS